MPVKDGYANGVFSWIDLQAHDLAAARTFYGDVFEWKYREMKIPGTGEVIYVQASSNGHHVAGLGQMDKDTRASGMPAVWGSYVNVDDAEATVERATKGGGAVVMAPMDVMGEGTLAVLRDPQGAVFGLWQPGRHHGAQLIDEPYSLTWNELVTTDPAAAKEFYSGVFGWTYAASPGAPEPYDIIYVEGGRELGNGGVMAMPPDAGDAPPAWLAYVAVPEVDATANAFTKRGGGVVVGPMDIPPGRMVILRDPQGAMLGVFSPQRGAAG